jgi:FtsP/CotA-like multicopper oxidase with cupredoxin domain
MRVGQTIKIRFIGSHTMSIHPMHIHGGPFTVVAVDGETLAPMRATTQTGGTLPQRRLQTRPRLRRSSLGR